MRLIRSPGIGIRRFWQLWNQFNNLDPILSYLKQHGGDGFWTTMMAEDEIARAHDQGVNLVIAVDEAYPTLLKTIVDKPPILYCKGHLELLTKQYVGIVGARASSHHGQVFAQGLGRSLVDYGWFVISGLARGIDTAAHLGAGASSTIAVLASGVDICYPAENKKLYNVIGENGCIISEMPMGEAPKKYLFPQRNRIIAGIAKGIAIVEAKRQSGSLITARCAVEYGREVFAVPGSPLEERARGCHDLLRQGAFLLDDVSDIINVIGDNRPANYQCLKKEDSDAPCLDELSRHSTILQDPSFRQFFQLLSSTPVSLEDIQQKTSLDLDVLLHCLSELELQDLILRQGDYVILKP